MNFRPQSVLAEPATYRDALWPPRLESIPNTLTWRGSSEVTAARRKRCPGLRTATAAKGAMSREAASPPHRRPPALPAEARPPTPARRRPPPDRQPADRHRARTSTPATRQPRQLPLPPSGGSQAAGQPGREVSATRPLGEWVRHRLYARGAAPAPMREAASRGLRLSARVVEYLRP